MLFIAYYWVLSYWGFMLNWSIKQLYAFEAVVRLSSFTKAGRELNITQPAVYMQIQQLQNNIGTDLIDIKGKRVYPTYIGEKLYKNAVKIIDLLRYTQLEINSTLHPETGHLSLAVATTTHSYMSRVLADFKRLYPQISFYLQVTNRKNLLKKLTNRETDLVIMGEPPKDKALSTSQFMDNPLIVIAPPKHKLLKKKYISIVDLSKETLITREIGSGTRTTIENVTGLDFTADIQINANEAIIEAVQAGLGIGFVSQHTVGLALKSGTIKQLQVDKFPIIRHWFVVHAKSRQLSPIAQKFKDFIITTANEQQK